MTASTGPVGFSILEFDLSFRPLPWKMQPSGEGLNGAFSLLGGIHHGNMTFTAPLHLLIKGIHKQSTFTLVTRSQQSWWWDHTMWHNAHDASFKQRAEPHTKLHYVLCRYLGFSASPGSYWTLHRSRITQIYKHTGLDTNTIEIKMTCRRYLKKIYVMFQCKGTTDWNEWASRSCHIAYLLIIYSIKNKLLQDK